MAAAAGMTVDLVADHVFTPAETLQALTEHVDQYRERLAALDGKVGIRETDGGFLRRGCPHRR